MKYKTKYETMKIKTCTIALAAAVAAQFCAAEAPKVREALFPLTDVRLTGGPLKAQQEQSGGAAGLTPLVE